MNRLGNMLDRRTAWLIGLVVLYALGVTVRRGVFEGQRTVLGPDIPFTLESALQYRMVERVYETGGLPEVDRDLQYPEGVVVRETDSVGEEYVYAALARLFPSSVPLAERIRWIEVCWFCLGIPLLALWIAWATGSRLAGLVAGAFYAVALSGVIRSTGQEISRENYALPLLVAHLAFDALAGRAGGGWKFWLNACLSAVLLGLAAATWDMVQFYLLVWAAAACWRMIRGGFGEHPREGLRWTVQALFLVAVCLVNPYLKAHAWLQSPALLLVYGVLGGWGIQRLMSEPVRGRRVVVVLAALAPLVVGLLLASSYGAAYGHFGELLWAKIRFLNRKPADPSLLTFNQRIMWVPALHSAGWGLAWALFPAMLLLTLPAIIVVYRCRRAHPETGLFQLLTFYCASLVAFCGFVRFHVFLAVFASGLLGWWLKEAVSRRGWRRWAPAALLAVGWAVEAGHAVRAPERWGRSGVYYRELGDLVDWIREYAGPDAVLANFGVSASILAYGERPIVLHPKFESAALRERVREYGEALFKGTEAGFRDWALAHGARYYVYSLGEFSEHGTPQQMRYAVDALDPPEDAAARVFEFEPAEAKHFQYLWGNAKYRVFRVMPREDKATAAELSARAGAALLAGDLGRAEELAARALDLNQDDARAQNVMRHVGSLRDQGFSYERDQAQGED